LLVVGAGLKTSVVKGDVLRFIPASKTFTVTAGMNELPNIVYVFKIGITLPGGSEQQPRRADCSYVQCWGDRLASYLVLTMHNSAKIRYLSGSCN
jgi:hypothetical protein